MKCLSQERMANHVKKSKDTLGLSQEELSSKTGMNRQMIGHPATKSLWNGLFADILNL